MAKRCLLIPLLVAAGLVLLPGCRTAPLQSRDVPLDRTEAPSVFLVASKEKPAVRRSLIAAGFSVEERHLATPNFLRVTIGSPQGSRDCGSRHNVRYELAIEGTTVIDLRRNGYTGTCEPSVLDVLSKELYERLGLPTDPEGETP